MNLIKSKYYKKDFQLGIESDLYALDILRKLSKEEIKKLSLTGKDNYSGRVNSSITESEVLNIFNNIKLELLKYDIRIDTKEGKSSIQDFKLNYNNREILTNIKITNGESYDNAISWKALSYILTGKKGNTKKDFLEITNKKNFESDLNYYFFVINKKTNNIIINSLKTLNKVVSNPSNPPFQIKWDKTNETPDLNKVDTNNEYIVKITIESIVKNVKNEIKMVNKLTKLINEENINWNQ